MYSKFLKSVTPFLILLISTSLLTACKSQEGAVNRPHGIVAQEAGAPMSSQVAKAPMDQAEREWNTEGYNLIDENELVDVTNEPLSTFSIDVDTASYSNIRRFINDGRLPPKDAVRIEEMINYFRYDYPGPSDDHPFSVNTEIAGCPWNPSHNLVLIGLQGRKAPIIEAPPNNLVFLLDVSGSMDSPDKLPLLKTAFKMLVEQMREVDRVAIVVYAGAAGLVLPSTPGDKKAEILEALGGLQAGGSTAGGAGIQLAYQIAKDSFIPNGNNRVILATDGDFNVGVSSDAELVRMIEQKRESGIFLTVLGFGAGNLKDSKMEQLADKGNGQYAYIDTAQEARKMLVSELGGTLFTIAKDVKIQVEFNPARIRGYRLIGYENRMLRSEDFNDDKKDAGELGSGHSVTALYEIIPSGTVTHLRKVDPLKYQSKQVKQDAYATNEAMTVKLRYKFPNENESRLISAAILDQDLSHAQPSHNLLFASAVAEWGMLLRDSKFKAKANFSACLARARQIESSGIDNYRAEFIELVQKSEALSKVKRSDGD